MQPASNRPLLKVSFLIGGIVVAFVLASFFPEVVISLIISTLAAFVLKPFVKFLEFRVGVRRILAILLVFSISGLVVFEIAIFAGGILIETITTMANNFKTFPFEQKLGEAAQQAASYVPFLDENFISEKVHGGIKAAKTMMDGAGSSLLGFVVNLAIVPFITFFILAEGDVALKKLIQRVPNKYFEMTLNVLNRIQNGLIGYMRGWILDSMIIGILSIIGYKLIGVEYAVFIGAIAGIANLVPYLGPVVGAVPAFLVSLTQFGDFRLVVPIVIVTFAIQLIDNIIVQPLCFAKTVDLHPVTVILLLLIGNTLLGIAGMLVIIPIFTILKTSAIETYWGLRNYQITA
ncbi:MAG: AI-2E family transporter [Ignavibacteriales bacterium]|nr:AI-2E family transporter [Ignavibacteriales bacterium]